MEKTKIIETKYGKIQGYIEQGINIFKGIPYSAPPVEKLRFKPPTPPKPWKDTLNATEFSTISPQPVSQAEWLFGPPLEQSEEKSLTLNIWTPNIDKEKRPVMFWIHGGNYNFGSSAQEGYDGLPLSLRGNIIVVTINYRLGPLGYLYIPEKTANVGHLDQIAALHWVHDNIESFGGDPNNVTIFGESAGGHAVVTLLAMPTAKGLFHRAIAQSPYSYSLSSNKEGSDELSTMLNIESGNIEELQKTSIEEVIKVHTDQIALLGLKGLDNPFCPIVDGKTLLVSPLQALKNGFASDIPFLTGTTRDEMRFMRAFIPNMPEIDSNELLRRITEGLKLRGYNDELANKLIDTYTKEREDILPNNPQDVWEAFLTDVGLRIFSIRAAEAQSMHQKNTYMYMFTRSSPWFDGKLGASHAIEVPYVFGTLGKPGADIYHGKGEEVEILSEKIMDIWIAFAHTGNPNNKSIPKWPSYNSVERSTMILGKELKIVDDPFGEERKVWDKFNYK